MIQVLERSGTQEMYLDIIKAMYSKPTANIKLNGEKLTAIQQKSADPSLWEITDSGLTNGEPA